MSKFKFEPQTTAEVVRAGLLMLIGFKVFEWDESQQILVFAFLSMLLTWITRSFSIPEQLVVDAGSSVAKLRSAAETRSAIAAGDKPPLAPGALSILLLLALGAGVAFVPACADNDKPNLTPVGRVADNASEVIRAAEVALTLVDAATPTVIPRQVTVNIANVFIAIGKGGVTLADSLAAYKKNVTPESWRSLQTAIVSINGLVSDAIALAPEGPARERVKQIAAPIIAALFAITLPPPPAGATPSDQASFDRWLELRTDHLVALENVTQ